jgi:MFS family permease
MIARVIAVFFAYTANNWYGFLGFGVFIGLSANWSQTNPVSTTLVSESVEEDKMSTALSIYSSAGTLFAVVSSPLGGYLAENQGYYLIFISCIVGELLNAVIAQLFLAETLSTPSTQKTSNPLSLIVPERSLMPFYLSSILTMFSWRVAFSNLNAILVDSYGITTLQLGLIASTFSLSWGLLQTPIGVFVDRYPKRQFLILSRVGFLLIALGFLFFKSFPVFILLQVISGIAHAFGIPSLTSMVLTSTEKDQRATVMAKLTTLPQIVSIPAPIIGAYLYELYGFNFIVSIRVAFILASILVLYFLIKPSNN